MLDENAFQPSTQRNKASEIESILSQDEIDLWALRELCLSEGGLVKGDFLYN